MRLLPRITTGMTLYICCCLVDVGTCSRESASYCNCSSCHFISTGFMGFHFFYDNKKFRILGRIARTLCRKFASEMYLLKTKSCKGNYKKGFSKVAKGAQRCPKVRKGAQSLFQSLKLSILGNYFPGIRLDSLD